ncbi:MAG: QueT transporter family protein [Clostridiales bacterium]|nr:QueT transporter family protein [Clostridiales bacterium]
MKRFFKTRTLVQSALIGALYAVVTMACAPISFSLVQVRVSEALTVLPYLTPTAVPGLFIGCVAANFLCGAPLYDVIFGSLATLLGALLTYLVRRQGLSKWLAPLPPVLANALIVGALMKYVYMPGEIGFLAATAYVAAGQLIACYGLGMPLLAVVEKYKERIFKD